MGISVNDLMTRARTVSVDVDQDALVTGAVRIFSLSVSPGTTASTVFINDALLKSGGGTTITVKGLAHATLGADTVTIDFGPGGTRFATGISIDSTGTGVAGLVQYMVE